MMGKSVTGTLLCTLLLATPSLASADRLYRYLNDAGVPVLDRQGVPPQYVDKGYEVLNEQGRVIEVIAPAPSPEEMQAILAERARAETDQQLRRLYSTPEDVERAKQRKLRELDGMVTITSGNLASVKAEQAALQSQAAGHERAGRTVPADLVGRIEGLKSEQDGLNRRILRFEESRVQIENSFDSDRDRLIELLRRERGGR